MPSTATLAQPYNSFLADLLALALTELSELDELAARLLALLADAEATLAAEWALTLALETKLETLAEAEEADLDADDENDE